MGSDAERWVEGAFAFLCERRVSELVPAAAATKIAEQLLSESASKHIHDRVVVPLRERILARLGASALACKVWLPDPVRETLANLLGRPVHVPRETVNELLQSEEVREETRVLLIDTLLAFVQYGVSNAPGGKSVRGVMGFGMRAAGAVLGGIGGDLVESRVREFADKAVGRMLKQLADHITSPGTARALGVRRKETFLRLLERTEAEGSRLASWLSLAELDALIPALSAHNVGRAEFRAGLQAEITGVLDDLSQQTVGELFDTLGIRELVREAFVSNGAPLLEAYWASPHFSR